MVIECLFWLLNNIRVRLDCYYLKERKKERNKGEKKERNCLKHLLESQFSAPLTETKCNPMFQEKFLEP